MQLSTLLSIILACVVAAAAIPLKLESAPDGINPTKLHAKVKQAMTDVNTQIPKMQKSLDDAAAGVPEAVERVRLAFGPQGVNQIPIIRNNIQTIQTGTVQVSSLAAGAVDKKHRKDENDIIGGFTPIEEEREKETDSLNVLPVEFGTSFFDKTRTEKQRASILLHESAHALLHASDNHDNDGKMVPFGLKLTDEQREKVVEEGGYASDNLYPDSGGNRITDLDLKQSFKDLRDKSPNMHMNADSYALFGAVCDQQMERRRKRALMEDDPVAYYLAKRGAAFCELPPDYFKKKAAAKAAKEKASSTSTASKAGLTKTTKKSAAGVRSGSQKTIKGGKSLAASKSTLKALGKVTKSTLPKTSKSGLSKASLKGSKAKIPTSRGKLSNSKTSRLLSKVSNGALKGPKSKVPTTKVSKALSRGKLSKSKTSKPSSKATKGALKGSMSKSLKAKTTKAKTRTMTSKSKASKPLPKSLKSTRTKSVKANASKASSKKAVKSKASGLGSSRAVPEKGTKTKVTSANRSSLKKGAAGAARKGGTRGVNQVKKPSTPPSLPRGQQTSRQSSKLTSPKSSEAKTSKATAATRNAATAPKTVRTEASTPAQKATKLSTAPKVAKALSKSVDPLNVATLPKKKNGKP